MAKNPKRGRIGNELRNTSNAKRRSSQTRLTSLKNKVLLIKQGSQHTTDADLNSHGPHRQDNSLSLQKSSRYTVRCPRHHFLPFHIKETHLTLLIDKATKATDKADAIKATSPRVVGTSILTTIGAENNKIFPRPKLKARLRLQGNLKQSNQAIRRRTPFILKRTTSKDHAHTDSTTVTITMDGNSLTTSPTAIYNKLEFSLLSQKHQDGKWLWTHSCTNGQRLPSQPSRHG